MNGETHTPPREQPSSERRERPDDCLAMDDDGHDEPARNRWRIEWVWISGDHERVSSPVRRRPNPAPARRGRVEISPSCHRVGFALGAVLTIHTRSSLVTFGATALIPTVQALGF